MDDPENPVLRLERGGFVSNYAAWDWLVTKCRGVGIAGHRGKSAATTPGGLYGSQADLCVCDGFVSRPPGWKVLESAEKK